jgi:hypothetical protein
MTPGNAPKRRKTLTISSAEDGDWIKLANPVNALTEIYIHEVMARFPAEEHSAVLRQTDEMAKGEKVQFILDRFREWDVELPYWWQE